MREGWAATQFDRQLFNAECIDMTAALHTMPHTYTHAAHPRRHAIQHASKHRIKTGRVLGRRRAPAGDHWRSRSLATPACSVSSRWRRCAPYRLKTSDGLKKSNLFSYVHYCSIFLHAIIISMTSQIWIWRTDRCNYKLSEWLFRVYFNFIILLLTVFSLYLIDFSIAGLAGRIAVPAVTNFNLIFGL